MPHGGHGKQLEEFGGLDRQMSGKTQDVKRRQGDVGPVTADIPAGYALVTGKT